MNYKRYLKSLEDLDDEELDESWEGCSYTIEYKEKVLGPVECGSIACTEKETAILRLLSRVQKPELWDEEKDGDIEDCALFEMSVEEIEDLRKFRARAEVELEEQVSLDLEECADPELKACIESGDYTVKSFFGVR